MNLRKILLLLVYNLIWLWAQNNLKGLSIAIMKNWSDWVRFLLLQISCLAMSNVWPIATNFWNIYGAEKMRRKTKGLWVLVLCYKDYAHPVRFMFKMIWRRHLFGRKEAWKSQNNISMNFSIKHIIPKHDDRTWPIKCYLIAKDCSSLDWSEFESDFWLLRCFRFVGKFLENEEVWEQKVECMMRDDNDSVFEK